MKKFIVLITLFAYSVLSYAQQDTSVCYQGSITVSCIDTSSMPKYQWQTKLAGSDIWEKEKDWNIEGFLELSDLTTSLSVRCLVDRVPYDQEADTIILIAEIAVLPKFVAGVIGKDTTICYDDKPGELRMLEDAQGAEGKYRYQWQYSTDGRTYDDAGTEGTMYEPGSLQASTWYRLKFISDYGCREVYSEGVKITVYEVLRAGEIGRDSTICNNTEAGEIGFSIRPSGAGGEEWYGYRWQRSEDGEEYSDEPEGSDKSLLPGTLQDTVYYRVVVSSDRCGTSDTSNAVRIAVLPELRAGKIAGADTICYNDIPRALRMLEDAQGAEGKYRYQWQDSTAGGRYADIAGKEGTMYEPGALQASTWYRLKFISDYGCGEVYSDSVKILVNPLPPEKELIGDMSVCNNTYDLKYFFENTEENTLYEWEVFGGEMTEHADDNHIVVHWNKQAGNGSIRLRQTYLLTSCYLEKEYVVVKTEDSAPDKTRILQKKNSNILICEDNTPGIHYEWGFCKFLNNEESLIEESDYRYVKIPHMIDTVNYDYFVITKLTYDKKVCENRTYWLKDVLKNDIPFQEQNIEVFIAPNPTRGNFSVTLENLVENDFTIEIQTLTGQTVYQKRYKAYGKNEKVDFSVSLAKGLYLLVVRTRARVLGSKIVIE